MIHLSLILEDLAITATSICERNREVGQPVKDEYHVVVCDTFTNKQATAIWNGKQVNAVTVLALGMGEDGDIPPELTEKLYEIVRPLLTDPKWEGLSPVP